MMKPGLLSVTFRKRPAEEVIRLAVQGQLRAIEWGGDVHAPHGDLKQAREIRRMGGDAGLEVSAYGSYYRLGRSADEGLAFSSVLETARELGAPCIRVWAGAIGSAEADAAYRERVVEEARAIAEEAAAAGIGVASEFHGNTLTDTAESAENLLRAIDHPNFRTFWQPHSGLSTEEVLAGLDRVLPWVTNTHVFHWWPTNKDRHPLEEGRERWLRFFRKLREGPHSRNGFASLEFLGEDSGERLLADAASLRSFLAQSEDR